jgi:hypothetical protein
MGAPMVARRRKMVARRREMVAIPLFANGTYPTLAQLPATLCYSTPIFLYLPFCPLH